MDENTPAQMHWEIAKLFWDGAGSGDRRQVWFSHRDPVAFAPGDYDDVLWRLGESGFEAVAYHAWPAPDRADGGPPPAGDGPASPGLREVTLFKRPLGHEPTQRHHGEREGEAPMDPV